MTTYECDKIPKEIQFSKMLKKSVVRRFIP